MQVKVKSRFVKTSPQKIRTIIDVIRNDKAALALAKLKLLVNHASNAVEELLKSGIDAASNKDLDYDNLYISEIYCDEGPKLKRRHYRARGRASQITKRMSHITLILEEKKVDKKLISKNIKKTINKSNERVGKNGSKS